MKPHGLELPNFHQIINSAMGRIRVHGGVNATLWLAGLIAIPAFLLALLTSVTWLSIVLISLGGVVVVNAIAAFWYVLLTSPHLLRSEDLEIRQAALEMLGEKGSEFLPLARYVASIAKPHVLGPEDRDTRTNNG